MVQIQPSRPMIKDIEVSTEGRYENKRVNVSFTLDGMRYSGAWLVGYPENKENAFANALRCAFTNGTVNEAR